MASDNVDVDTTTTDLQPSHVQTHNSTSCGTCTTTSRESSSSPRLKVECTSPRGALEGHSETEATVNCPEYSMELLSKFADVDITEPVLSLRMLMNSKVSVLVARC